jgi:glucose-6-phosphate dehydrogenase assembly protein OpcA
MRLIPEFLVQLFVDVQYDDLAEQIVNDLESIVWDRVKTGGSQLAGNELRGYLAARAGVPVRRAVTAAKCDVSGQRELRAIIEQRLVDRLARRLSGMGRADGLCKAA